MRYPWQFWSDSVNFSSGSGKKSLMRLPCGVLHRFRIIKSARLFRGNSPVCRTDVAYDKAASSSLLYYPRSQRALRMFSTIFLTTCKFAAAFSILQCAVIAKAAFIKRRGLMILHFCNVSEKVQLIGDGDVLKVGYFFDITASLKLSRYTVTT